MEREMSANKTETIEIPPGSMALTRSGTIQIQKEIQSQPRSRLSCRRRIPQAIMFGLFRLSVLVNGGALLVIVYFLVVRGWQAVNWTFLTQPPTVKKLWNAEPGTRNRLPLDKGSL